MDFVYFNRPFHYQPWVLKICAEYILDRDEVQIDLMLANIGYGIFALISTIILSIV